jgi:hypothetical protein
MGQPVKSLGSRRAARFSGQSVSLLSAWSAVNIAARWVLSPIRLIDFAIPAT